MSGSLKYWRQSLFLITEMLVQPEMWRYSILLNFDVKWLAWNLLCTGNFFSHEIALVWTHQEVNCIPFQINLILYTSADKIHIHFCKWCNNASLWKCQKCFPYSLSLGLSWCETVFSPVKNVICILWKSPPILTKLFITKLFLVIEYVSHIFIRFMQIWRWLKRGQWLQCILKVKTF
jgi:hypothetical protein